MKSEAAQKILDEIPVESRQNVQVYSDAMIVASEYAKRTSKNEAYQMYLKESFMAGYVHAKSENK